MVIHYDGHSIPFTILITLSILSNVGSWNAMPSNGLTPASSTLQNGLAGLTISFVLGSSSVFCHQV